MIQAAKKAGMDLIVSNPDNSMGCVHGYIELSVMVLECRSINDKQGQASGNDIKVWLQVSKWPCSRGTASGSLHLLDSHSSSEHAWQVLPWARLCRSNRRPGREVMVRTASSVAIRQGQRYRLPVHQPIASSNPHAWRLI
jgi:hypothetical protein